MAAPNPTNESKPNGDGASDKSDYQYEQKLITEKEWIKKNATTDIFGAIKRYLVGLFPILSWIYRYNITWGLGGNSVY